MVEFNISGQLRESFLKLGYFTVAPLKSGMWVISLSHMKSQTDSCTSDSLS